MLIFYMSFSCADKNMCGNLNESKGLSLKSAMPVHVEESIYIDPHSACHIMEKVHRNRIACFAGAVLGWFAFDGTAGL